MNSLATINPSTSLRPIESLYHYLGYRGKFTDYGSNRNTIICWRVIGYLMFESKPYLVVSTLQDNHADYEFVTEDRFNANYFYCSYEVCEAG